MCNRSMGGPPSVVCHSHIKHVLFKARDRKLNLPGVNDDNIIGRDIEMVSVHSKYH